MLSNSIDRTMPSVVRMATIEQPRRPASATVSTALRERSLGPTWNSAKAKQKSARPRADSGDDELARSFHCHLIAGGFDGIGFRRHGERNALAHQTGPSRPCRESEVFSSSSGESFSRPVLDHVDGRHRQGAELLGAVDDVLGKSRRNHRRDDGGRDSRPEDESGSSAGSVGPEQHIGAVVAGPRVECRRFAVNGGSCAPVAEEPTEDAKGEDYRDNQSCRHALFPRSRAGRAP